LRRERFRARDREQWEAFGTAATGMHSRPDFDLSQDRVFARCESHIAGEDKLAPNAPDAATDLRDAHDRRLGETDERIQQDRKSGRPGSLDEAEAPRRVGQVKVGKVELRIRALEYDDTKARAGIHSSEQVLEAFEYAGADDVERRIIEQNPPIRGRFLGDAQVRR
jgi:hypothetical protein